MKPLHIALALATLVAIYLIFLKKKPAETPSTVPVAPQLVRTVPPSSRGKMPIPTGAQGSRIFDNRQEALSYYRKNRCASFVELSGGGFEVGGC